MKNKISYLIAAAAVVGLAQVASAIPTESQELAIVDPTDAAGLYLYDTLSGSGVFVGMQVVGGLNNAGYTGSVGGSTVVISASGTTYSAGSSPSLDLDINSATVETGSTLLVLYSDGTFGPSTGSSFVLSTPAVGASNTSTVTSSLYSDTSAFGLTSLLATESAPGSAVSAPLANGTSYYLTVEDSIGAGLGSSLDTSVTTVPDGGTTAMLLGAGLSGLALLKRKLVA